LDRWRIRVIDRLNRGLEGESQLVSGYIKALALGDTSAISRLQWQHLKQTGTVHLLVVSGLHVAIVALLGFWLGTLLGRILGLLHLPVHPVKTGGITALIFSGSYVLLS